MKSRKNNHFSEEVSVFQEKHLPEKAILAGYSALINAYDLAVPLPCKMSAMGARHKILGEDDWYLYAPRHMPEASLEGHLVFALK